MSPFVRGRIIGEVESSGLIKTRLDVLLWIARPSVAALRSLDAVEGLRIYLSSLGSEHCTVNLWVPSAFQDARNALTAIGISFQTVEAVAIAPTVETELGAGAPAELKQAASTAIGLDADVLVVSNPDWFPYAPEIENLNVRLSDPKLLERHCEIFVRGHEVPWSFRSLVWDQPWTGAYHFFETSTFLEGLTFLERASKHKLTPDVQEAGRSFVHNRVPNLCYTRDKLLFCDLQRSVARRRQWERQEFQFEIGYFLNFYYLLIYGGFDQLALIVNGSLNLGVPQRSVGTSYEAFLTPLRAAAPEIYALFNDPKFVDFRDRIGAARHYAAHRGSIAPGNIYEELDPKPTDAELDAEIARRGMDEFLRVIPPGAAREAFRAGLRAKVLLSMSKLIANSIVFLEIRGKWCYIDPMADIRWNFERFHDFTDSVFKALNRRFP
jgi:hypothetical protein